MPLKAAQPEEIAKVVAQHDTHGKGMVGAGDGKETITTVKATDTSAEVTTTNPATGTSWTTTV
jgi:hypothetical protein